MGQTADVINKLEAKVTELKATNAQLTAERDALKATQPDDADKAAVSGVDSFLAS